MNPIAVFQHSPIVDPGYFASFLDAQGMPWRHIRIDQGEAVPESPAEFSGLCFMGGVMSVNDPLPWIPNVLHLIRQAVATDTPIIGHCLGGQLLAKALGGAITRNPVREIGWGTVTVANNPISQTWLGDLRSFDAFHWHGDTFSLPANATPLLASNYCCNQAFVIGPHLGMQCHVEMTETLIRRWNQEWAEQTTDNAYRPPSIQPAQQQLAQLSIRLPIMRAAAHQLYLHWLENVRRA